MPRYSQSLRPAEGQTCYFYPVPCRPMIRAYLRAGEKCVVVHNSNYVVEVQFVLADDTDLISPEFLTSRKIKEDDAGYSEVEITEIETEEMEKKKKANQSNDWGEDDNYGFYDDANNERASIESEVAEFTAANT